MKTLAIASITGAVILYLYLAVAHIALTFHDSDFKYTPEQGGILQSLSGAHLENGFYFLPYAPPEASMQERKHMMEENMGKPVAMLNYTNSMEANSMAFVMGFIYNLISVIILCIALAAANEKLTSFGQRLWFVMLFALFVLFSNIMMSYNWMGFPMHFLKGQIIDVFAGYFLVGLWLSWYYGRVAMRRAVVAASI